MSTGKNKEIERHHFFLNLLLLKDDANNWDICFKRHYPKGEDQRNSSHTRLAYFQLSPKVRLNPYPYPKYEKKFRSIRWPICR